METAKELVRPILGEGRAGAGKTMQGLGMGINGRI